MSKEKQIEETKSEIFGILYNIINGADFDDLNEAVYKIVDVAGYRKQSELTPCDVCQFNPPSGDLMKPCSSCLAQAKMKGGAE